MAARPRAEEWGAAMNTPEVIRAERRGSTTCTSDNVVVHGDAPILALCRQLLAAGLNPDQALEVFRGSTLAVRVRSIGEAAALEINAKGSGFVPRPVRTASPMRQTTLNAPEARSSASTSP